MVLLSGLNRTITESAILSCKWCGKMVYSEGTARFRINGGRQYQSTNAIFCHSIVQPCITTLEEVASWVLTQSLPLQAGRYLVLHGKHDVCPHYEDKHLFVSAWRTALFHFYPSMNYFIKLLSDGSDHRMQLLIKHPLWLAILITGALRVRRYLHLSPEGLQQGEFKMSRNEYAIFGLDQTQSGQITRALENLIRYGFIHKSDTKAGRKQINVFRFATYDIIAPYLSEQTSNRQQANRSQTAHRQEADNNQTRSEHSRKNKSKKIESDREGESSSSLIVKEGVLGGDGDNFKIIMNHVEREGTKFLKLWNTMTARSDLMDEKIKKGLYNIIESISLSQFQSRVTLFQNVRHLIETHKLQKYLYYRIELYDCGMFLGQINTFYGDEISVFEKIIIDQDRKTTMSKIKALIRQQQEDTPIQEKPPALLSEEQKAKIRTIKEGLVSQFSTRS
ncbi:MAG TPA: hypothetical protein PK048_03475 [Candidatus Absconditabacterales bacterium]|nr:hypothetical protein [Candidatus Absconditabacterales bacterium]